MGKINIKYYVFLAKLKGRLVYFNSFIKKETWIKNSEECYFCVDIFKARQVKKRILELHGVNCRIIKVNLLEVR